VIFYDRRGWMAADCGQGALRINDIPTPIQSLKSGDLLAGRDNRQWVFSAHCSAAARPVFPRRTGRPAVVIESSQQLGDWSIIGESNSARRLREELTRLARTSSNLLISGEIGVGKRHFARALHAIRDHRRWIVVECPLVRPEDILGTLEQALVPPGSPGAAEPGVAHVILDDVGTLSAESQTALLELAGRMAQYRWRGAYGNGGPRFVSTATTTAAAGPTFGLSDRLFEKLAVAQLQIDPLRSRLSDLRDLAEHFLRGSPLAQPDSPRMIPDERLQELVMYDWPGNLAELQLEIERWLLLRQTMAPFRWTWQPRSNLPAGAAWRPISLEEVEREHIAASLQAMNWTKSRVARVLGIERSTLDRKIKRYGISPPPSPQQ
jgi:Nif-specific regulatory protein